MFKASSWSACLYADGEAGDEGAADGDDRGGRARGEARGRFCADVDRAWVVRWGGVQVQSGWAGCVGGGVWRRCATRCRRERQLIVNTTSASGGSVAALERPGRAVIAATKTGTEKNATVFARYWVEALQDPTADTDKSESISAMEAFQYADRKTADFMRRRSGWRRSMRSLRTRGMVRRCALDAAQGREGALLASLTVVRIGAARRR